jgi:hypothetical protein
MSPEFMYLRLSEKKNGCLLSSVGQLARNAKTIVRTKVMKNVGARLAWNWLSTLAVGMFVLLRLMTDTSAACRFLKKKAQKPAPYHRTKEAAVLTNERQTYALLLAGHFEVILRKSFT